MIQVYPLTFSEFWSSGIYKDVRRAWRDYSTYDGLPFLCDLSDEEDKIQYLTDLFSNVYFKDVVERYTLQGDIILNTLTDISASDIGSLTDPNRLAKTFSSHGIRASAPTISAQIDHLIDASLIEKEQRHDVKEKKYIDSPFKYYFADIGLRNSRLHFRRQEPSHIMENILFNDLIARWLSVDIGIIQRMECKDGKRAISSLEIDFVCNRGDQRSISSQLTPFQMRRRCVRRL